MSYDEAAGDSGGHDILTEKQCRVLDLLIENKTSKEIARELGISPHTVDQRILLARGKLGVASRNELANYYREMRRASAEVPLGQVDLEENQNAGADNQNVIFTSSAAAVEDDHQQQEESPHNTYTKTSAAPPAGKTLFPTHDKLDHRVGPEVFEGKSGVLWRSGAIVATALLLVMTILGLLAIFDQLNDILA